MKNSQQYQISFNKLISEHIKNFDSNINNVNKSNNTLNNQSELTQLTKPSFTSTSPYINHSTPSNTNTSNSYKYFFKNINFSPININDNLDPSLKENFLKENLLLESTFKLQPDAVKALNDFNFDDIVDTTKKEISSILQFNFNKAYPHFSNAITYFAISLLLFGLPSVLKTAQTTIWSTGTIIESSEQTQNSDLNNNNPNTNIKKSKGYVLTQN